MKQHMEFLAGKINGLPSGYLTWPWKMAHLYMVYLLKMVIFQFATLNNRGELWETAQKKRNQRVILDAFHFCMMCKKKILIGVFTQPHWIAKTLQQTHRDRSWPCSRAKKGSQWHGMAKGVLGWVCCGFLLRPAILPVLGSWRCMHRTLQFHPNLQYHGIWRWCPSL